MLMQHIRWQEKTVAQVWHTKRVYIGVKKGLMYGMNLCRYSNEILSMAAGNMCS